MVKKSTAAVLMAFVVLVIGGCAEKKVSDTSKPESTIIKLGDLLNKTQKESKVLLGEGKDNSTNEGVLLGKAYESKLYDKDAAIHTMYDEKGIINMIQVEFSSWKADECAKVISGETGVSMTKTDKGESGQNYGQWKYDKKIINMFQYNDTVILEIFAPVG